MPPRCGIGHNVVAVSIHAHQYWRAMPQHAIAAAAVVCFNPRPPILAGDAYPASHRVSRWVVSIHAHQYWRAMPPNASNTDRPRSVSIHAHQYWRAMRASITPVGVPRGFQSTPTNTGGRCFSQSALPNLSWLFQSTPTNTGGRCGLGCCRPQGACMFQSTPTNTGGRCLGRENLGALPVVSIHAHQYWRAMLRPWPGASGSACFNPRPPILAGDAKHHPRHYPSPRGFNPRPPILAGDAPDHGCAFGCDCCFNPRPPILAGDARPITCTPVALLVSIHAHQYWRAMPLSSRYTTLPAPCFNPRPPILAGDAHRIQPHAG